MPLTLPRIVLPEIRHPLPLQSMALFALLIAVLPEIKHPFPVQKMPNGLPFTVLPETAHAPMTQFIPAPPPPLKELFAVQPSTTALSPAAMPPWLPRAAIFLPEPKN